MEIEGALSRARKYTLKDYLRENKLCLESIFKDDINLPSILVKFVEEKDYEKIWEPGECDPFYEAFLKILSEYGDMKDNNNIDGLRGDRYQYLRSLTHNNSYCETIVAFVSDLNFRKYINPDPDDKIIPSPGIYVKEKKDDKINLDFVILYSLIKAQIYYSMSRTDILKKYEGINSVLYSAMALKVMNDSEFQGLLDNHKNFISNRLAGSWAIPIILLNLSSQNKSSLDDILDHDLIRRVFFGEDIDEKAWLRKIIEKLRKSTGLKKPKKK